MGLFSFFSKKPEDLLKSGDELFEKKQYAPAVRDYEKALDKHQKDPTIPDFNKMVSKKIASAKKALAHQHIETARTLMESRCFEDATELLNLAMELSDSSAVSDTVKALLEEIQTAEASQISEESDYRYEETYEDDPDDPDTFSEADFDDSEYAFALFSSMPEEEQAAYQDYGQAFIRGFVALNQGDFERAADYLKMALDENTSENPDQKTYIPLELGTAYLNLGELEKAKDLLEKFLADFPMSEKGYQIYCEILWGLKEYEHALALLQDCPEALSQTALITYLTGETHAQTENPDAAITTYKKYLERNAEEEVILRALGNLYEKTGEAKSAQAIYATLMNACSSCGRPADADLKKRYADTSFATGQHTVTVLEMYLELAANDPDLRGEYFNKVSVIYKALGNDAEAKRFAAFAKDISP